MLKTSLLAVLAVFVLAQPAMAADTPAGDVTAVKGNVVLHQSGRSVPSGVAKGDKLFAGDEISTESKSSVTVTFANGGTVGIGPKGVMTINATPQQVGVKINNAGFAATGESPAIETACGTVTVKTGNLVQAEKEGACFAYVTEGTAMIKNNAGLTVLTAGQGTKIAGQGAAEAASTWNEEQVSWMRAHLPEDTLPSLKVAPPAPAPVAAAPEPVVSEPVVAEPAAPAVVETAPEAVVEETLPEGLVEAPVTAPEMIEEVAPMPEAVPMPDAQTEVMPMPAPMPDTTAEELPDATAPLE